MLEKKCKRIQGKIMRFKSNNVYAQFQSKTPLNHEKLKTYTTEEGFRPKHMIYDLEHIGWSDLTYTIDRNKLNVNKKFERYRAYPDYKYKKNCAPSCIYIPTQEILIKLMRACSFITKVNELVYFDDRPRKNKENDAMLTSFKLGILFNVKKEIELKQKKEPRKDIKSPIDISDLLNQEKLEKIRE